MKNINDVIEAVNITETTFYKNDYLRPFIYTYLNNPKLYKGKFPFKLLHNYCFGTDLEYKDYKHTYVFAGYRWLNRKFWPLFIAITQYNNMFDITGFSTYDSTYSWFEKYKDLGFVKNLDLNIRIENNTDLNGFPSLDRQIKAMGETVLKHLNIRKKL